MAYAYHHEDVSILAKSLKKQLLALGKLPGHVELLNMLARAAGSQNYQSWLASSGRNSALPVSVASEDIELRLMQDSPSMEVFAERRPDGSFIDRRREKAPRVHLLIEVELCVDALVGTLRAHASIGSELLPAGKDPDDWLKTFVLPALESLSERNPGKVTIFGEVDLALDSHVKEGRSLRFNDMRRAERVVAFPLPEASRLRAECEAAEQSSMGFERVKEILWDLLGRSDFASVARKDAGLIRALGGYLNDYLAAEGDMFMGSWNREKLAPLAESLTKIAQNPRSRGLKDWDWFRRSVFAAHPPHHWTRPLLVSDDIATMAA